MTDKIEYDDLIYVDAEPTNKPYLAPLKKLEEMVQPLASSDKKVLDSQISTTPTQPKPEEPSRFGAAEDWLVGAAPMLVGLLAGNTRIGAQVGGQGLQDMAKTRAAEGAKGAELAEKLKTLKTLDSARYYRTINTYDENGMPVTKIVDVRRPDQPIGDWEKYRAEQLRTNPTTGELGRFDPRKKEMTPLKGGSAEEGFTVKQEKDLKEFNEEWIKGDAVTKEARPALAAAYSTMSLLSGNNPIATDVIKTQIVRASGQASNSVSDRDVKGIGTLQSVRGRVLQIKEEAKTGKLTEENRYYLKKLLENMAKNREELLYRQAKTKARKYSISKGLPQDVFLQQAREDINSLKVSPTGEPVKMYTTLKAEQAKAARNAPKGPKMIRVQVDGEVFRVPEDKLNTLPKGAKRLD
jgi:hypothetical protein